MHLCNGHLILYTGCMLGPLIGQGNVSVKLMVAMGLLK